MEGKNFLLLEDADSSKKILRDQIAEIAAQFSFKYGQRVYILAKNKCPVGGAPNVLSSIPQEDCKNIIYMYPKDSDALLNKMLTLHEARDPIKLIIIESLQDFGLYNQDYLKFFPSIIASLHDLTNVLTKKTNETCLSIITAKTMPNVLQDIFFYRNPKMYVRDKAEIQKVLSQI